MTRDIGNNLSVFIVFYWNKSLKPFVSTVWKVHSQFWHQTLRFFRKQTYITDLEITEQLQHWRYYNHLKSNQLHWLSAFWCSIQNKEAERHLEFGHFSLIQYLESSSLKEQMTTWATAVRCLHSWMFKNVSASLQLWWQWRKLPVEVFVMITQNGAPTVFGLKHLTQN